MRNIREVVWQSAGDWGKSNPLAVPEMIQEMKRRGHGEDVIRKVVHDNPLAFFRQSVRWEDLGANFEITVLDEGPGISGTKNLFVPFFTTKPKGSGIGLVLCRQLAEAHGGTLTLENRTDRVGCAARLILPVHAPQ